MRLKELSQDEFLRNVTSEDKLVTLVAIMPCNSVEEALDMLNGSPVKSSMHVNCRVVVDEVTRGDEVREYPGALVLEGVEPGEPQDSYGDGALDRYISLTPVEVGEDVEGAKREVEVTCYTYGPFRLMFRDRYGAVSPGGGASVRRQVVSRKVFILHVEDL